MSQWVWDYPLESGGFISGYIMENNVFFFLLAFISNQIVQQGVRIYLNSSLTHDGVVREPVLCTPYNKNIISLAIPCQKKWIFIAILPIFCILLLLSSIKMRFERVGAIFFIELSTQPSAILNTLSSSVSVHSPSFFEKRSFFN